MKEFITAQQSNAIVAHRLFEQVEVEKARERHEFLIGQVPPQDCHQRAIEMSNRLAFVRDQLAIDLSCRSAFSRGSLLASAT